MSTRECNETSVYKRNVHIVHAAIPYTSFSLHLKWRPFERDQQQAQRCN